MSTLPIWACINAQHSTDFTFRSFKGRPVCYWPLKELLSLPNLEEVVVLCGEEDQADWKALLESPALKYLLPKVDNVRLAHRIELEKYRSVFAKNHESAHFLYLSANAPLIHSTHLRQALRQLEADTSDITAICSAHVFKSPIWSGHSPLIHHSESTFWMPSEAFWASTQPLDIRPNQRLFHEIPKHAAPIHDEASYVAALATAPQLIQNADIKLFLTDVDGVMTDGGMYYTEEGEFKRFHVHDGMALQQLQASGVKTGIITSEDTDIVQRRAAKLRVDYLHQGKRFGGKLDAALAICQAEGITLQEVAYIGDDINCISLLKEVGIAACPSNATRHIQSLPGIWVMEKAAGQGVVREFIETLFPHVI